MVRGPERIGPGRRISSGGHGTNRAEQAIKGDAGGHEDPAARSWSARRPSARATARRFGYVGLLAAPLAILIGLVGLASQRDVLIAGSDLRVYLSYADRLVSGSVPYRGFHLEYPPLALAAMAAPRLAWPFGVPDLGTFAWLFTIAQGGMAVLGGWLIVKVSPRPVEALGVWALLVLAACVSMAWRYDLWPAVLVLVAVVAAELDRPGAAGIALGVGTMMKLFPLVLVPILAARSIALRDGRGLARLLLGTAGIVVVVMAGSIGLAGGDAFQWLTYQLDRGLQIETTGAGLLLLLHAINGLPLSIENAFGSLQVRSAGADALAAAAPFLELGLVAAVSVVALVRFRRDLARFGRVPVSSLASAGVAVLASLLVPSKVFSAQYIVWFLPLVPLLAGRQRWLVVATAALSTFIYPLNYTALWQLDPTLTALLNLRNLLLVVLLAWLLSSLGRTGTPASAPARGDRRDAMAVRPPAGRGSSTEQRALARSMPRADRTLDRAGEVAEPVNPGVVAGSAGEDPPRPDRRSRPPGGPRISQPASRRTESARPIPGQRARATTAALVAGRACFSIARANSWNERPSGESAFVNITGAPELRALIAPRYSLTMRWSIVRLRAPSAFLTLIPVNAFERLRTSFTRSSA